MKFYNRDFEIDELKLLFNQSLQQAKMTVITGRRRMGKTVLALHASSTQSKFLYFFVSKKTEVLLCEEYLEEIKKKFDLPFVGKLNTFSAIFDLLLKVAEQENFTLIIDEFQEFYNINSSVYSDLQKLWDLQKFKVCKLNLILIGSVYSLMHKIFVNSEEPLFGRADSIINLKPFKIKTILSILNEHHVYDSKLLFDYYVITGGTPKYIDLLITNKATNYDAILNFMLRPNSLFLQEGRHVLIEEFGKEYNTYFSILQLIANGNTTRGEIESILQKNIGGYLERLLVDYAVIAKHNPIDATENSKLQKYKIIDNFLNFWFRFIYKHFSAIENENFSYIMQIINRDYTTYCGKILEKFYHELFWDTQQYNRIGSYWEKGNQNEIDLIAINDLEKKCIIADIKLNEAKLNIAQLKNKAQKLCLKYADYSIEWLGLSLNNIDEWLTK